MDDYLSLYFNRGGVHYDEGFKHLKVVEKAGLRAETRRKGHPERLFVSTLTPEKSRRWHGLTFSRYSLVHTGCV